MMPRSSPYPYVHQLALQTNLHPLWNVHFWVSEMPSSHSSSLLHDLGYCSQPPCSSSGKCLPYYTRSWCLKCWSPGSHMSLTRTMSQGRAPIHAGSKSLVHPTSGLMSASILSRIRARGPKCPKCQKPRGREFSPSSKVLYQEPQYQESDFSIYSSEKQKSATHQSQFSSKHLSQACVLGLAGQCNSVSSAVIFFRQTSSSPRGSLLRPSLQSSSELMSPLLTFGLP